MTRASVTRSRADSRLVHAYTDRRGDTEELSSSNDVTASGKLSRRKELWLTDRLRKLCTMQCTYLQKKEKDTIRDNYFLIYYRYILLITIYNLARRLKLSVLFKRIWFKVKSVICFYIFCIYTYVILFLRFSISFNHN